MRHWIKALPGLLAYSVFGGLIAIAAGGFHSDVSGRNISRTGAVILTVLLVVSCGASFTFKERELSIIDRILLLIFIYCLVFAMISDAKQMFAALATGTACLLLGATVHRFSNKDKSD
jgi:hypothetical protein